MLQVHLVVDVVINAICEQTAGTDQLEEAEQRQMKEALAIRRRISSRVPGVL